MAVEEPLETEDTPPVLDNPVAATQYHPEWYTNSGIVSPEDTPSSITSLPPTIQAAQQARVDEILGSTRESRSEKMGVPLLPTGPAKREGIEKAPNFLTVEEFDVQGLYEAMRETGENHNEAMGSVGSVLLEKIAENQEEYGLTDEDLEQLGEVDANELLIMFTDVRDRSDTEALVEGAAREGVLLPPSMVAGLKTGKKVFLKTRGPWQLRAAFGVGAGLLAATAVRGVSETALDAVLTDTPLENNPLLPEDTPRTEAARAFMEVFLTGAALRPYPYSALQPLRALQPFQQK